MAEMSLESSYALPSVGTAPRTVFANQRTMEILEQRRASSRSRRRGWLMRRMLLVADILALAATFAIVEFAFGAGSAANHHFGAAGEYALLLATIPGWIVIARIYGLYDRDEERTHHPTSDDFTRVFHLVTVGTCFCSSPTGYSASGTPTCRRRWRSGRSRSFSSPRAARSPATCAGAASRTSRTLSSSVPVTWARASPASSCAIRSTA